MLKKMLSEMPEGFYSILTGLLGDTGEPVEKGVLLAMVQEYMKTYGIKATGEPTGFVESIVGFRFMSSRLRGAEIQRGAIDARRQRVKEENRKKQRAWRRKHK
jgi:hypothetical protein